MRPSSRVYQTGATVGRTVPVLWTISGVRGGGGRNVENAKKYAVFRPPLRQFKVRRAKNLRECVSHDPSKVSRKRLQYLKNPMRYSAFSVPKMLFSDAKND